MTSKSPSDGPDSRSSRWMLVPAALAGGALAITVAVRRMMNRPVPALSGRLTVDGLEGPVEIIRDLSGIPHIYARTEHDLFFAQGYAVAQDRLFQLDLHRRAGLGRVAEIIGPIGLPYDRFARYLGWPRAAAAQMADVDDHTRAVVDAFASGINAFIETQPLPAEFTLLAYHPEPWTPLDTAAWGTILGWGLSCNWETELLRAWLIDALGPEKAADLTPGYSDDYACTIPDERVGRRLAAEMLAAFNDTMAHGPLGMPLVGQRIGSNNWVVSGDLTASGRPQLANDPHLPPLFPAIWYGCHLVGAGYDVIGFTLPGAPGIVIGHNQHVAWGVTNAFPDIQDVYIERFDPQDPGRYAFEEGWRDAEKVQETIRVRGRRPVAFSVRYTHHGPVFSDMFPGKHADLSADWTLYHGGNQVRAVLEINRATDAAGLRDGLRHWSFPSQNVVFADVRGEIGYVMPGLVPKRRSGHGLSPVPGWTGEHEWDGWIPFDELPVLTNPADGIIATANNYIAGDSFPYILTGEWLPEYRVRRIRELLLEGAPLTLADHCRIQNEAVSLMARRFLATGLPLAQVHDDVNPSLRDALDRLQAWDARMSESSVAATIYFGWLFHFTAAAVRQAVGPDSAAVLLGPGEDPGFPFMPFHEIGYELALRWLESGAPEWVGDVRPLLMPALAQTLAVAREKLGDNPDSWAWGRIHQVTFAHQMVRIPAIGRLWRPVTVPAAGDGYTVNQSDLSPGFPPEPATVIASCRLVMDVGDWDACLAALPGGQSGHPASPHYQDRIAEWRDGRYFPLHYSRAAVERAAAGIWRLTPAAAASLP